MSFKVVPRQRVKAFVSAVLTSEETDRTKRDAEIAQRVQQEVAQLREQAEADGRAQGEAEGRRAAQADGAAAIETAIAALRDAWTQLAAPLAQKEHDLAALVTDLSFELARHIVGVEVNANADSLKALVARLIQEAASERAPRQSIVVRLNPADHVLLAPFIQIENMHSLTDATISRGGALVEIIAPDGDPIDKIEWDATIESRIDSIRAALALHATTSGDGSAKS